MASSLLVCDGKPALTAASTTSDPLVSSARSGRHILRDQTHQVWADLVSQNASLHHERRPDDAEGSYHKTPDNARHGNKPRPPGPTRRGRQGPSQRPGPSTTKTNSPHSGPGVIDSAVTATSRHGVPAYVPSFKVLQIVLPGSLAVLTSVDQRHQLFLRLSASQGALYV